MKRMLHLVTLFAQTATGQHHLDLGDKRKPDTEKNQCVFQSAALVPRLFDSSAKVTTDIKDFQRMLRDEPSDRRCGNSHLFALGVSDARRVSSHLRG